jgi:hypothetical protein
MLKTRNRKEFIKQNCRLAISFRIQFWLAYKDTTWAGGSMFQEITREIQTYMRSVDVTCTWDKEHN